ncbi:phage tail domain-containing protein [Bacillus thuringiensis]|uniref:phage tail domain-containing protein n=1 Tax=Bacillus thuringiensis TaxID=1428 RepID=UPI000BF87946|nr:phage tail domain-containing protein [Bacillus thuringiensis]PFA41999.1 hypothetical protein CN416_04400 [Bacillus thuringiensis]
MVVLNAVNNLPNFDFKGKNSLDMKVYLTSKPSIPSPEMRVESVPVKGRDSSYTITDGTYEDLDIVIGVRTYRGPVGYQDTLNTLNEWLRVGWDVVENEIVFSEYPQWVFKVKTIKPYTWDYNSATGELTTMLTFTCDPFKYSDTYREVVGVTTNPVPMPPREFKIGNFTTYQVSVEQNLQSITDLNKYGNTRVINSPNVLSKYKDFLRDNDSYQLFAHQNKYTSGSYRNFIDDFYSSDTTVSTTNASLMSITVKDALRVEFRSSGYTDTFVNFTTVDNLTAGKDYYLYLDIEGVPTAQIVKVFNPSGVQVARVDSRNTLLFKAPVTGKYRIEFSCKAGVFTMGASRLHLNQADGKSIWYPSKNSTYGAIVTAFNMNDLLNIIEPNMITSNMTESQMKTTLKARNLKGIYNAWASHQTSCTALAYQYNSATNTYDQIGSKAISGLATEQTFKIEATTSFIDRLYYSGGKLWAIFMLVGSNDFVYDYAETSGKFMYSDKISLSLGVDVQPSSSKDVFNNGTADAFPFLKIWKQEGANTCKITFTSTNYNGTPYKEVVEVRNLNNVAAGQHIEVDCDFKDVVRYQENNPSLSVPWTSWTIAPRFPTMKVGKNNITVENASKVEIEWRTRRI